MKNRLFVLILILIFFSGCKKNYTPKPRGYFRIGFPEKTYTLFNEKRFPYQFDIPGYSEIQKLATHGSEPFDITISIPENKADIHITYKEISKNKLPDELEKLFEDSRTLAYKHSIKADAIEERIFLNPASKVYGSIYIIGGNVASPMQFYLTDSVRHFLRGAFYIRDIPNIDSLKPVIDFVEPDIIRLIETTAWK
jgi:gliding motility-associated lipoprotein GldD